MSELPTSKTVTPELLRTLSDDDSVSRHVLKMAVLQAAAHIEALQADATDLKEQRRNLQHDLMMVRLERGPVETSVNIPRELSERLAWEHRDSSKLTVAINELRALLKSPEEPTPRIDPMPEQTNGELCQGCPPIGYPTDSTRCETCPRRNKTSKQGG